MATRSAQIQGQLQQRVMRALWDLGRGNVEEVRQALPARQRGAYTTIQTVLNRLAERGLIMKEREGNVIFYTPAVSESDYYSRSLSETLARASSEARRTALAQIVGELTPGERNQIDDLAREIASKRKGRKR